MKIKIFLLFTLFSILRLSAVELSLSQCRQMALESSELLKISQNKVVQSDLDRGIARTAYLPKLSGSAMAMYMTPNSSMGDAMELQLKGVYMAGFNIVQPVYAGGKIVTANKLARLGRDVADLELEATRMDVIADAEKTYWMYVAVLSKIDMLNAYMTQLDSLYDYTKFAYDIGMTTELNLMRVESKKSELQYRLRQAQSGCDICRLSLCRIVGLADDESITPTEKIAERTAVSDAFAGIDNRPELGLSKLGVTAKKHDVSMVRADFLPTLGLQIAWNAFGNMKMKNFITMDDGTVYPFTQTIKYNGFSGVLSLSVPIFHWGEGLRKGKKAKIEVENASLQLEYNTRMMELEARQAYNNYMDSFDAIRSAQKAYNETRRNLDIMNEQYEAGLMTLTDLLDAQSQWQTAYSNLIEAQTQHLIYRIDYRRSTGTMD